MPVQLIGKLLPLTPYLSRILRTEGSNKPLLGFFSPENWRSKSLGKTLRCLSDPKRLDLIQSQAFENLSEWEKVRAPFPHQVQVYQEDWGVAALNATKRHGVIYPILNNASAVFPGGLFLQNGSAQEENLFHRSTLALTLADSSTLYDEKKKMFLYDKPTYHLINAETKMSPIELDILSSIYGKKVSLAFKVFFKGEPHICFREPEYLVESQDPETRLSSKSIFFAESSMSFLFSEQKRIFPFYDFRSAAIDLSNHSLNLKNEADLSKYQNDLERRIAAQLDTLILYRTPRAILGALGCGCYKNPPELVAKIYRQEIIKRAPFFEHLVFAIASSTTRDELRNFSVFKEILNGLALGPKAIKNDTEISTQPLITPH